MDDQPKRFFDLWFVGANTVTKEVPFHVVTDWVQQGRAGKDDRIKPSGTADWYPLGSVVAFQAYFPEPEPKRPADVVEAMAPVEMDFDWRKPADDEDDEVDMIPLIDISLVLLIFFMMTMTVSAISRIQVPDYANGATIETNPGTIRIDIDQRDGRFVYGIALGTLAPAPEDDNLGSDVELKTRLDARLANMTSPPKVRIAAHGQVPSEIVFEIMNALEDRRGRNPPQVGEISIEVNERAQR